jgi:hypothetical protein
MAGGRYQTLRSVSDHHVFVRLALARDGYALVKCEHAVFKPEA